MIKLKPCPFCGETENILTEFDSDCNVRITHCDNCGAKSNWGNSEEDAKEEWNKRHGGWIKCSDRMPTDVLDMQDFKQIKVLVSTKNNLVKTCLYRWIRDYNGNYTDWEFSVHGVIAWQPLPEPYKEDGE